MKCRAVALAALLALALHGAAFAGRSCETRPASASAVERGLALAARTQAALDATGAQAVVLARAGQDLSRYGLRWSHVGIAYRDPTSGQWRVVHKLNHCGSARADVYRQGLGPFFLDDPFRYEAAYAALAPSTAKRVAALLTDDARATSLHGADYSMVAYPWSQRYQQSNQWAIETLAAAEAKLQGRDRAQAWLKLRDYRPTTLHLNAIERLGARVSAANVAFDDHPNERRFADRIDTVTADSVFEWLARSGLGSELRVVR